jgi:integrative and conjugative element protein (TIGR02256 family)
MIFENNGVYVILGKNVYNNIIECCKKSVNKETGGIIAGYYSVNLNTANITYASPQPIDSLQGFCWFKRGVNGLKKRMDNMWYNKNEYYLGEWHYHPNSKPDASKVDIIQMHSISRNKKFNCPEPIMIIIGGNNEYGFKLKLSIVNDGNFVTLNPYNEV